MKNIFLLLLNVCFSCATMILHASDNPVTLGNIAPSQLKISINSGGTYCVYRWLNGDNGFNWQKQFYAENSHLFSIKIGNTIFSSGGTSMPTAGFFNGDSGNLTGFILIEDIGTTITTGVAQEMTKKFTGIYNGNSFNITIKITYNTSSPFFIKHATIDVTNIPTGTPIIFSYGWDTYVNIDDNGYALIMPDLFNLNNNPTVADRYLTTAQVQSLRFVGASNNTGDGSLIAFFPIGRNFDRAYSANPYNPGYCFNVPLLTPGNGTNTGNNDQYKFQFGPYVGPFSGLNADNGQGVGYDNIPAGQITEIKTGLTFTPDLDGELDYFWNNQKNLTATIGDNVNLNLAYQSIGNEGLNNIGFRVGFTGLQIRPEGCSTTGFIGGTTSCVVGNEYYQLSGASINLSGEAIVNVPVNITRAGQWVIDGNSITNMTQTLPLGSPATLTVTTTVSLADATPATICRGESKQYTVKFPNSIIAAQNVIVYLSYSGATTSFSLMPSSVTIPAGANSATFLVTASATGADNAAITITLSGTNQAFATVAPPSSSQLTIDASCHQDGLNIILFASPPFGGTVSGGGINIPYGTDITVSAVANDNYVFERWIELGSLVSLNANYSFIVTRSRVLVAIFQGRDCDCGH